MATGAGRTAMVLAAGLGTRMRPVTDTLPKPLVRVGGKPLLDHALDQLLRAGVEAAVVNVHYLADRIEAHLAARKAPLIFVSDERATLLDTGGGIRKALPRLGPEPFFVSNADSLWRDGPVPLLDALRVAWQDERMDCLLALAPQSSLGYEGRGDFMPDGTGRLRRESAGAALVNTGIYLVHPRLFDSAPKAPFSMNLLWDRAIGQGRLFGLQVAGEWMHVGTPAALAQAEARLIEL